MTPFEFISVALSFVLGLGVTRLLLAAVNIFRNRRRLNIDWVPLAWAAVIFLFQIQYWWAIFELSGMVEEWTGLRFITLLSLAMLLFVAGALVLPTSEARDGDSLAAYFERDGRWALIALAGYFLVSLWANWFFWAVSPVSLIGAGVVGLLTGTQLYLWLPRGRAAELITLLTLALSVFVVVKISPASY